MGRKLKLLAFSAAIAAGTSGVAMAQYACPPGYALYGGVCQPVQAYAPSNPVSGAAAGGAAGAAAGGAAAGPVGAIVGGAVGTATGAVTGATNEAVGIATGSSVPPPASPCPPGMVLFNGACYPR